MFRIGVKRWAAILSPAAVLFFAACGGDDTPPPPIVQAPQVTAEIVCANETLDKALAKCKEKINDALPLLLTAKDQGQALAVVLQAGQAAAKDKAQAIQAIQTANQQKVQKMTSDANKAQDAANQAANPTNPTASQTKAKINVDPRCTAPIQDPDTSCKDDIITALLVWKSAHKSDGQLAANDQYYQNYLMQKLKSFVSQSASQAQAKYSLTPDQLGGLAASFQGALVSNAPSAGMSSGAAQKILNNLNASVRDTGHRLSYLESPKFATSRPRTSDSRAMAPEEPTPEEKAKARLATELVSRAELMRAMKGK